MSCAPCKKKNCFEVSKIGGNRLIFSQTINSSIFEHPSDFPIQFSEIVLYHLQLKKTSENYPTEVPYSDGTLRSDGSRKNAFFLKLSQVDLFNHNKNNGVDRKMVLNSLL